MFNVLLMTTTYVFIAGENYDYDSFEFCLH